MKKTTISALLLSALLTAIGTEAPAQTKPDTWTAQDALGRKIGTTDQYGKPRKNKVVGMFFVIWHGVHGYDRPASNPDNAVMVPTAADSLSPYDNQKIIDANPQNPQYGAEHAMHHWGEPYLGYYVANDEWVIRKHAQMLSDAGVDMIMFDVTNQAIYLPVVKQICDVYTKMRKEGNKTPQISFIFNTNAKETLENLFDSFYGKNLYKELWFRWKGKPLIMAYPDNLTDSPEDRAIRDFFTFRPGQPDYVDGPFPTRKDQWSWLEIYPQHGYIKGPDGGFEQVSVGVAQNTSPDRKGHCGAFNVKDAYGRNFSVLKGFDPRVDGYLYGWNFQEQWNRALELDPELVFVTEWNEFIAGQWLPEHGWDGFPFSFVDLFDSNHSRDIEPNAGWGDKGDVYYLQLVDNIRKFKGMTPPEKASAPQTIKIGKADGWDDVAPYFASYKGNTMHRDHRGRYDQYYTNNTGRNDIVGAKVARDADNVYFYVETADKLTPATDRNWMMLFIDVDRDKTTGWNGYDFIVNRTSPHGKKAVIEKNVGGRWEWEAVGESKFAVNGNKLELAIAKQLMNLTGDDVDIEFKWNDNMQENGNIMDFYVNGDTAPGGRFNYVYTTK